MHMQGLYERVQDQARYDSAIAGRRTLLTNHVRFEVEVFERAVLRQHRRESHRAGVGNAVAGEVEAVEDRHVEHLFRS